MKQHMASLQSVATSANDLSEVQSLLSALLAVQRKDLPSKRQERSRTVSSRDEIWNGTKDRIILFLIVRFSHTAFLFSPRTLNMKIGKTKWQAK